MEDNIAYPEIDEEFEKRVKHAVTLAERDELKSLMSELEIEYQNENKSNVRHLFNRNWLNIAAAVLLLAGAVFTFQSITNASTDQLAANYYQPYPNGYKPITRSQPQEVNVELKGLLAYESERYQEALTYFEQLPSSNEDIRMFKAISNFELGKFSSSKSDLKYLIDKQGKLLKPAQWYMALVLLKEGSIDQAKKYMEVLANQPLDSSYQRDASEILKKIK